MRLRRQLERLGILLARRHRAAAPGARAAHTPRSTPRRAAALGSTAPRTRRARARTRARRDRGRRAGSIRCRSRAPSATGCCCRRTRRRAPPTSKRQDFGWKDAARRQPLHLDDAGVERPALAIVVGLGRLLPVQERLERVGLRDVQVVAGDHANARAAADRRIDREPDPLEPRLLNERRHDRDLRRPVEEREHVTRERILLATGGERRHLAQVVALARHDVTHAAARVVHVAAKPRDHVHVQVHHGLARRRPGVEPDVVAVRRELLVEPPLHLGDQRQHGALLVLGGAEPVRRHPPGHDQRVPGRHRKAIAEREGELVRADPRRFGHLEKHRHARRILSCSGPTGAGRLPVRQAQILPIEAAAEGSCCSGPPCDELRLAVFDPAVTASAASGPRLAGSAWTSGPRTPG